MKNNKRFLRKKPSKEAIEGLFMLYGKNPALKTLVKKFDLDITGATAAPLEKSTDKNNNEKQITMNKKFKNEIVLPETSSDQIPFAKFDNIGEEKECTFKGKSITIPGEKKFDAFVVEISGEEYLLPTNKSLMKKVKVIIENTDKKILEKGIEMCVVFDKEEVIEGYTNKAKIFKVFVA